MSKITYKFIPMMFKIGNLSLLVSIIFLEITSCAKETSIQQTTQATNAYNEAQMNTEIEEQHQKAREEAQKAIVQEGVDVINDTKKAIKALYQKNEKDALEALKKATGTADILLSRYPLEALLPIEFDVKIIDTAPRDLERIKAISRAAEKETTSKHYPEARLLLDLLRDEVHIRIIHLPLGIYPSALKTAAALLEEKKIDDSIAALATTLNTLVISDQVYPIPLIRVKVLIFAAEEKQTHDKEGAGQLLAKAYSELRFAKELGYASTIEDYDILNKEIKDLEKNIKNNKVNLATLFSTLKNKLSKYSKRLTDIKKHITFKSDTKE